MKNILLLGAGQSASTLIQYLLDLNSSHGWGIAIGDANEELANKKGQGKARGFAFNVTNQKQLEEEVAKVDLVISMLPARFHIPVANACLKLSKHLVTASYVSDEMRALDKEAKKKGLVFLNECGLDPGIDHMSAMQVIDQIRNKGNKIIGFESFTGGLLAPTDDENPWKYKFTWNPRNVVLAGQGVVKFIQEGRYKFIPYHRLFRRTEIVHIPKYGEFEGYANRDSLQYLDVYNLRGIKTLYRGTFRRPGYSMAWNIFVQLGATDDSYQMEGVETMTHRQFINSFLSYNPHDSVELKLAHYLNLDMQGDIMHKLKWVGVFSDELVGIKEGTPAQILEAILRKKWTLDRHDRDMIVMWHKFNYIDESNNNRETEIHSSIATIGENTTHTAMSKTVGLPLGIATKLILEDKIEARGVLIPIIKELYEPILAELSKDFGFDFTESCVLTP
ncbi:MAG: saccharopine dehydrogenase NADP-binding domain-containing protein [Cyclobacteriaceae bacterium]|nr:saccharopine dehydrogenase NADP-binding domain-containing protein [Cyclobacteriaceae bacterium]